MGRTSRKNQVRGMVGTGRTHCTDLWAEAGDVPPGTHRLGCVCSLLRRPARAKCRLRARKVAEHQQMTAQPLNTPGSPTENRGNDGVRITPSTAASSTALHIAAKMHVHSGPVRGAGGEQGQTRKRSGRGLTVVARRLPAQETCSCLPTGPAGHRISPPTP